MSMITGPSDDKLFGPGFGEATQAGTKKSSAFTDAETEKIESLTRAFSGTVTSKESVNRMAAKTEVFMSRILGRSTNVVTGTVTRSATGASLKLTSAITEDGSIQAPRIPKSIEVPKAETFHSDDNIYDS